MLRADDPIGDDDSARTHGDARVGITAVDGGQMTASAQKLRDLSDSIAKSDNKRAVLALPVDERKLESDGYAERC